LHFVHKKYDSGHVLNVAVPVELENGDWSSEGDSPNSVPAKANPVLDDLMTRLTAATKTALTNAAAAKEQADPSALEFPKVASLGALTGFLETMKITSPLLLNGALNNAEGEDNLYFQYHGSLTAPPCNEIVTWFVKKQPYRLKQSKDVDVDLFRRIIYENTAGSGNYRSAMPMGGRPIYT